MIMTTRRNTLAASAAAVLLMAGAQAHATDITGSITFDGGFASNGYDPSDGGVPPGYGNEASDTVAVRPGIEFGFQDTYNRDTADFSPVGLTLEDTVLSVGASAWTQTFTADTPGYFSNLALTSDEFSGLNYSVSGDTLTVTWPGEYDTGSADYKAQFSLGTGSPVSAAPEPGVWALLLMACAGVGLGLRRAKRTVVSPFAIGLASRAS